MRQADSSRVRELLERIARVVAAEERSDELNAAQRGVLAYLARANQFSRAPSNVADYMCTTRGTASQTLKALERKGFVVKLHLTSDRRSIAYEVTKKGHAALKTQSALDAALGTLSGTENKRLATVLEGVARRSLERGGFKSFGVCSTCRYHLRTSNGRKCELLQVRLTEQAATEICHEHEMAEASA